MINNGKMVVYPESFRSFDNIVNGASDDAHKYG